MTRRNKILMIIAIALCVVSMIGSGLIQTDFGRVEMIEISIDTEVGTLTGYLFKPDSASETSKAPAVVASHGYLNNREMQDCNWVELARRGYVVFAMNAYGHGDSSLTDPAYSDSIQVKSGGMVDAVEYLSTLAYVDGERIGVTGHSMGGGYTNTTVDYYTSLEREALADGATAAEAHALNKVACGVIVGNYPSNLAEVTDLSGESGYLCDLVVITGEYDEFFGAYAKTLLTSDMSRQVVAVQTGTELDRALENGEYFENAANGYTIAMYQPREFHATNHFSVTTVGYLLEGFEHSFGFPNSIAPQSQIWWLKELLNLVGLIGFFMFIVPLADLLLKQKFFEELRAGELRVIPAEGKAVGKYVSTNIIGGVLSAIVLVPTLLIGYVLLINPVLPQDTTAGIGVWAIAAGLITWWMLRAGYGKKLRGNWDELGAKINARGFFKTLLLALAVVVGTYMLVFIADYVFQTDFRIWSFDVRVFGASKIWVALRYLPFFAVYYIFNSIAVNRSGFEKWSEAKQILLSMLFNIIAPAIILIATYVPVIWLGQTPWSNLGGMLSAAMALIPILMIPFVPILAIAAYIGVRCYKLTGRIWLGAFINAMMITMITVANTSFSFPY